jgi:hypothetical protein
MERSTMCSSDTRVYSSFIGVILIALPSIVESNWKSCAHNALAHPNFPARPRELRTIVGRRHRRDAQADSCAA